MLIPLLYILPSLLPGWGVMSVILAEPISDTLTALTNAVYFRVFMRKKLKHKKSPFLQIIIRLQINVFSISCPQKALIFTGFLSELYA